MIRKGNRVCRFLICAGSATLMLFVLPSIGSKRLQLNMQARTYQNIHDCDIDGSFADLEQCPSESIICQYKEKYDVTLTLRGGVYWEIISGKYVNEEYGYKVDLPIGLEALCTPNPMPAHGFFIDVEGRLLPPSGENDDHGGFSWANWNDGVYVEAYYNALFYESADDEVEQDLEFYKKNHPTDLRVLSRGHTRLLGVKASSYSVWFVDSRTGEPMFDEQLTAIRKDLGIIYCLGLIVSADSYQHQKEVLRTIRRGFRFIEPDSE